MFDSLTKRLGAVLGTLKGKARLSAEDVDQALREIRVALLEADVALPVVRDFIERVRGKATGADLIKTVAPAQQVIKIVHDEIMDLLGRDSVPLDLAAVPPVVILMAGLQGSGKTTTTAKLGYFIKHKLRKRVMLASLDTVRPAAQDQLAVLGKMIEVDTLPIIPKQPPVEITQRALAEARKAGADVLILDTAGRLSIDDALMEELKQVVTIASPRETLLVVDAMTGQDALTTAQNFQHALPITGLVLTRIDGDQRGGAALSLRAVTGQPIKFLGTGEKWDALEPFHPDRLAGRILDQGDVVSLVERAIETIDRDDAAIAAQKFKSGTFDFTDLLAQFKQMEKMGGMGSLMTMLPGLSAHKDKMATAMGDGKIIKRQEALILSMTPAERIKPDLLNASRRRRIASGAGLTVQDVNKLVKQLQQMQTMMKQMKKMGMGKMMGMMQGMLGGRDTQMLDDLAAADQGQLPAPDFMNRLPGQGGGSSLLPGLGGGMTSSAGPFGPFSTKPSKRR